ncbi:desmoplakin-A-like [Conger conger]|uniref:desmoplakin-A-like n=1 Tax=Conger conger TaxID=82655 RepID=UPI002A5AF62D|nr:desmoplakin-A-like [Conger conger]
MDGSSVLDHSKTIGGYGAGHGGGHEGMEQGREQLKMMVFSKSSQGPRVRKNRGSSIGHDGGGKNFQEAMAWITQQKRLIETSPWGDDQDTIEWQMMKHDMFHSSIQRSLEMEHARTELELKGDQLYWHFLEQEWDALQKMSSSRHNQLRDRSKILKDISEEIKWVEECMEEELVFDWGDKNIDNYIPKKQDSYLRLMRDLEKKEKDLNKLFENVENVRNHPAADKIMANKDSLQTQWSWLLQITKCIDTHLKENAAYSQFFKEANEMRIKLQEEHENIHKRYTCDRDTPLEKLQDLLNNLEREKEKIMKNKWQVQHLVNKSKSIVRLKPRNPHEKSSSPVIVKALCDFKQDQTQILKGNEAILNDNSQRSKWHVTGPGGLDMLIPSVCLLVLPPNPLSISLANKTEQLFETIMGIWNQLFINIKSLISWRYCMKNIEVIESLTITMLANMRPEKYREIIKSLDMSYLEFRRSYVGSEMFTNEDKTHIKNQYQYAFEKLVGLPTYDGSLLSELHTLQQKLEKAESGLTRHIHIPLGENSFHECSQRIVQLEGINQDLDTIREEYVKLREKIQLDGMKDTDMAEFLRSELDLINQKIVSLEGISSSYIERLKALQALQQSLLQVEDIVKVNEARLTEKQTSSLEPRQLEDYWAVLKKMKQDLDQRDSLKKLELKLGNAEHWNDQISQSFHKCDVDLFRYREQVTQMSTRWRRILSQIDSRVRDLEKQQQHLQQYQQSSAQVSGWIYNTQQKQDSLLSNKLSDVNTLIEHLNQQKMLYSEIKGKKDKVDDVVRDANTCASSITDYELELASYSAGLETLLNIPIKRTMLQSPATVVREEATDIQAKYIELLTRSGDYYKFLGDLQNMEDFGQSKLIWLLAQYWSQTNQYLADSLARYQLDSKQELRSLQESLDKALRDYRAATEKLDRLTAELKALQQQLTQEQAQVREVNIRYEMLYKTIEEKSKMLNDHSSEIQRLQGMTESLTKERLRVEEELRALRQEFQMCYKELLQEKKSLRMVEQVQGQVQKNEDELNQLRKLYELKYDTEKVKTVQELTSLRSEIEKLTALEDRNKGQRQSSEWVVSELARIRDELEKGRAQKNEDELKQLRKVVEEWKSQYERKSDTDKGKLQQELESLTSEIKMLTAKLRALEVGDKKCSHTTTCISSFEVQLQTINKTVEQGLTQKNHDIEMLTTKLQSFEQVVSELARIRDELEKGRVQKNEDELKQLRKLYELKYDTGKVKMLEELTSLRGEIVMLTAKLGALEVGGNKCSHTSTYISSLKVQLQTNIEKVEQELTQNNKEIEMITTKLQSFEQVVSELAWIRDELEKGQAQKNEDELKQLRKVVEEWMRQYERKSDSRLQQEHESLWCEIKMLMTKLRGLEDGSKKCSHTSTCISSFEVQLQINNHEIERLTARLRLLEDCYRGRLQISEQELSELQQRELKLFQKHLEHLEERIKVHHHVITNKEMTVRGIRGWVFITDLVESKLLNSSDVQKIAQGQLTIEDIESKLRPYLQGSGCIAGIFLEKENRTLPIYQAKKEGLLRQGTSLVLLEAQAASGFMIDPLNNLFLPVEEACERNLIGQEFKSKLLSAENAVTGYKDPHTGDIISLFQAIEKGIIEKGHGIRLLEAQIASGGIIDPKKNHRIDVDEAFRRGYFNKEMNDILADEGDDTKGFFDPNTEENLTYLQLMKRCITDEKTGLVLLPLWDKKESRILRMREQECEWEGIIILAADSSIRLVVVDQKTGKRYDIQDYLDKGLLSQSTIDQYHSGALTLTEFADQILNKSNMDLSITSTCAEDVAMVEEDNGRKIIQTTTTTTTSSLSSTSCSTSSSS